jgi:outer membrane protein assembly factor BamB
MQLLTAEGHARAQDAVAAQLNAAHSGNIQIPDFKPPLKLAWWQDMQKLCPGGKDYNPAIPSYPIIAGNMVFVTTVCTPTYYTAYGFIRAFNLANGSLIWSKQLNTNGNQGFPPADAWLAYDNGKLLFSTTTAP